MGARSRPWKACVTTWPTTTAQGGSSTRTRPLTTTRGKTHTTSGTATTTKTHGNPHTATAPTTGTTATSGSGTTTGAGTTSGTGTGTSTTTTTTLNPIAAKLQGKPLGTRLEQMLLSSGMTLNKASDGFRNQGQFIAAVHVSQNR